MRKFSRRSLIEALFPGAVLGLIVVGRTEAKDQPHMEKALDHLRDAQRELEKASADKGGHRARAMTLVRQAIAEVEKGIRFDRRR